MSSFVHFVQRLPEILGWMELVMISCTFLPSRPAGAPLLPMTQKWQVLGVSRLLGSGM